MDRSKTIVVVRRSWRLIGRFHYKDGFHLPADFDADEPETIRVILEK